MSNSQQIRIFVWGFITALLLFAGFAYFPLFLIFAFLSGVCVIYLIAVPDSKKDKGHSPADPKKMLRLWGVLTVLFVLVGFFAYSIFLVFALLSGIVVLYLALQANSKEAKPSVTQRKAKKHG